MANHRSNRVEIEVHAPSRETGQALQARLSTLFGERLEPLLDRVCSELSGPGQLHRYDRLELDLGRIALLDFELDFCVRTEEALRRALARQRDAQDLGRPSEDTSIELLRCFAHTGNLPWWADHGDARLLQGHLEVALDAAPMSLRALLHALAEDAVALGRLQRLGAAGPSATRLETLLPPGVAAKRTAAMRGDVADGDHEASATSRRARAVTRAGAVHAAAEAGALRGREDRPPAGGVESQPPTVGGAATVAQSDAGRRQLPTPAPRWPVRAALLADESGRESGGDGERKPGLGSGGESDALPPASHIANVPSRAAHLPRPPGHAVDTVHEGLHAADGPEQPSPKAWQLMKPALQVEGDAVQGVDVDDPVVRSAHTQVPPPGAAQRIAARQALAQLEELYIGDAGLVLLWPFLQRCFSRCQLLAQPEQRAFSTPLAAQQAIALLSWMALENPQPPEHLLALPKLLCGLSPEMPVAVDDALAPDLQAEGLRLMDAAVEHMALQPATAASLRATCLCRAGVLSVRSGTWLLQVERQPQDVLLDRLNWTRSWVRLPWMADALQVEW